MATLFSAFKQFLSELLLSTHFKISFFKLNSYPDTILPILVIY